MDAAQGPRVVRRVLIRGEDQEVRRNITHHRRNTTIQATQVTRHRNTTATTRTCHLKVTSTTTRRNTIMRNNTSTIILHRLAGRPLIFLSLIL